MAELLEGASADDIEDEIQFIDILLETLQPDALDYHSRRDSLTEQREQLERRLDRANEDSAMTEDPKPSPPRGAHSNFTDHDAGSTPGPSADPALSSRKRNLHESSASESTSPESKSRRTSRSPFSTAPGTPSLDGSNLRASSVIQPPTQRTTAQGRSLARQEQALQMANRLAEQEHRDETIARSLAAGYSAPSQTGRFGRPVAAPSAVETNTAGYQPYASGLVPNVTLPAANANTIVPANSAASSRYQQSQTPGPTVTLPVAHTNALVPTTSAASSGHLQTQAPMPGTWPSLGPSTTNTSSLPVRLASNNALVPQPNTRVPQGVASANQGGSFSNGYLTPAQPSSINMGLGDPFADLDSHYSNPWTSHYGNAVRGQQPQSQARSTPMAPSALYVPHAGIPQNIGSMPGALPSSSNLTNGGYGGPSGGSGFASGFSPANPLGLMVGPPQENGNGLRRQDRSFHDLDYMYHDSSQTREEIQKLLENIRPDEDIPKELRAGTPDAFVKPLMEHQKVGLAWLVKMENSSNKGGILADDMGFGKTIQALALMVSRPSEDPRRKTTLIVAPVALLKQWEEEIKTKLKPAPHSLSIYIYHGPSMKRTSYKQLSRYDVVLTSYGSLSTELKKKNDWINKLPGLPEGADRDWGFSSQYLVLTGCDSKWYRVILDEAQNVKNKQTKSSIAACDLQAQYRWCLTGTPMMNNITELYSLILFLRIKPYNEWDLFRREFQTIVKPSSRNSPASKQKAMTKLHALLKAILLRRDKSSKIDGNPVVRLTERHVGTEIVKFDEDEQAFYTALESKTQIQFNKYIKAGTVGRNYSNILVLLLHLRQACCHPHLIRDFAVPASTQIPEDEMNSWVQKLTEDVINRIKATNGAFECPICLDAAENPAIFHPCGHDTCSECYTKLADAATQGRRDGGDDPTSTKCPQCRAVVDPRHVFDYETFKKAHLPHEVEAADDEDSSSDDSDSDDDDDDETSSLDGFVVDDDETLEAESETNSEDVEADKSARRKTAKAKGKGPGKKAKKERKPKKTLAQLSRESKGSKEKKRKYLKRLRKEYISSSKVDKTVELIRRIRDNDPTEKIIVFSQFTSLLDLLEIPLQGEKLRYQRYDGSMSLPEREEAVKQFKTNRACSLMIVSLKAGNAGLNLTVANQVIILDPFWNPYIEEQAIDRTHRIGQTKDVHVHRVLTTETIEDRIISLQEQKRELITAALDEKAAMSISRLGVNELSFLFGLRAGPN